MRWFLLKDRRYEGPFSKEEIQKAVEESRISAHDFIISEENRVSNPLAYEKVSDLLGESYTYPSKEKSTKLQSEKKDISREELSKEFEEAFDSKDLINKKDSVVDEIKYDKSPEEIFLEETQKSSFWSWVEKQQNTIVVVVTIVFLSGSMGMLFLSGGKLKVAAPTAPENVTPVKPVEIKRTPAQDKVLGKGRPESIQLPQIERREIEEVPVEPEEVEVVDDNNDRQPARENRSTRRKSRGAASENRRSQSEDGQQDDGYGNEEEPQEELDPYQEDEGQVDYDENLDREELDEDYVEDYGEEDYADDDYTDESY